MAQKPLLIVGNWKMYGRLSDLAELDVLAEGLAGVRESVAVAVCPPFTLTAAAALRTTGRVAIGVQNVAAAIADGAHRRSTPQRLARRSLPVPSPARRPRPSG